jgi:hypothetical protein
LATAFLLFRFTVYADLLFTSSRVNDHNLLKK